MSSSHLNRLETLLLEKNSSHDPEFKATLSKLAAEIKDRLETGSPASADFFTSASNALSRMKDTAHGEIRLNCLWYVSRFFFSNGVGAVALCVSRQLDELARRIDSKIWIRKVGTLAGMVHSDLGNMPEAVIRYADALSLARETHELAAQISVTVNLGIAFNYAGLYSEAIPCFEQYLASKELRS